MFFAEARQQNVDLLLRAVRQPTRDTMKEAAFAGRVEAYDTCLRDLEIFAKRQMAQASQ